MATTTVEDNTALSKQYETPLGLAHDTMQALKDRIKTHYDLASEYYLNLWGTHIHHGYWPTPESKASETKEQAQINLIRLLLETSQIAQGSKVLDVGCGIGGTSRYLASQLGCTVTGITISSKQVEMATRLTKSEAAKDDASLSDQEADAEGFLRIGKGKVKFVELDAEKMGDVFAAQSESFDAVWICEALSHFPNKQLFFLNAHKSLKKGGKLALADWFKAEGLGEKEFTDDIKPIEGLWIPVEVAESRAPIIPAKTASKRVLDNIDTIADGMLLPPLCAQADYVNYAKEAGLDVSGGPKDISEDVKATWDISWSLVQNPSLWAFALSQGRDGIAFLQAFRAMRRGYANGSFRYAVISFQK